MSADSQRTKEAVEEHYAAIARGELSGCGCSSTQTVARAIGYSEQELALAGDANLGLGCGNPLAMTAIRPGMTVLDLGSGAGFDAFIAWHSVGPTGRVIGVDMTDDMLAQARKNAEQLGAVNVEFRKGVIEQLPVEDSSIDLVISNCVINLSTDKPAVFREIHRVLKPGGQFAVSDLVLLTDLPHAIKQDVSAYVGCIAGASMISDYIRMAMNAGLENLSIPEIASGSKLVEVVSPGLDNAKNGCCSTSVTNQAAASVASIKLHGTKAA